MTTRIGINGFGRIGRLVYRALFDDPTCEVVAINDPGSPEAMAHLLKFDSVHGKRFDSVSCTANSLTVDGKTAAVYGDRDPHGVPWGSHNVDVVIESTGHFRDGNTARAHIESGARKVIITAPGKNVDKTIVMGVNDSEYNPDKHTIVSNASCTTNCLAPLAKVLLDTFGIKRGFMNTIHSYTNDQKILDLPHKDLRRARAAALSMIPTTTGAAKAVSLVIPELAGKFDGFATRVPTPDASMVDLTCELERAVCVSEVNEALERAAESTFKGIIQYSTDPLVSVDIIGNPYSCVFDSKLTMVLGDNSNFCKVIAWYDNEWAYSKRVADLAKIMIA